MTEQQINYILRHKCWPEDVTERTDRFVLYLFPFALSFCSVAFLSIGEPLTYIAGFGLIPVIVLLFKFLPKRLDKGNEFFELDVPSDPEKIATAMKNIKWTVTQSKEKYITAITGISWFSWGEDVTIIFGDGNVLFNSKPSGQLITLNNREVINRRKLLRALGAELI